MFVLVVGYASLFRVSELSCVRVKDVSISDDGISVFVSQRKNDQFREGPTSIIARSTEKGSCPILASPKESCFPVLRRTVRTEDGAYFQKTSYSTTRDEFKKYISPFVIDPGYYCLHTLKLGGASNDGYQLRILTLRGVTRSVLMLLKLLRDWVSDWFRSFWPVEGLTLCFGLHTGFPPIKAMWVFPGLPDTTRLMPFSY